MLTSLFVIEQDGSHQEVFLDLSKVTYAQEISSRMYENYCSMYPAVKKFPKEILCILESQETTYIGGAIPTLPVRRLLVYSNIYNLIEKINKYQLMLSQRTNENSK